MSNWLKTYISQNYLLSVTSGSKFEIWYLYISVTIILLAISYRLVLFARGNRPPVYKKFDRYLLWGYLTVGALGFFIWFSRSQSLPIFSTRAVSYLWILIVAVYSVFLGYYYKKIIPAKLSDFYEKKRKSKYIQK